MLAKWKRQISAYLADPDVEHRDSSQSNEPDTTQANSIVNTVRNGRVSVVDGRIVVCDPEPTGTYATLLIPDDPHVRVLVDGVRAVGPTVLCEMHVIQVDLYTLEPSLSFSVTEAADQMSVCVTAVVTPGVHYHLEDLDPCREATLTVRRVEYGPTAVRPQILLELLHEHGFRGEVDADAVARLCQATRDMSEVVLRGTPPVPGRWHRYSRKGLPVESDPLFRTAHLPYVRTGETVATDTPAHKAQSGRDVRGRVLPARTEHRTPQTLGAGVKETDHMIVATRPGRLLMTKDRIDVVPELILHEDVAMSNVLFDGNVVVQGDVHEGAHITATGCVTVYGNVTGATVQGDTGVLVLGSVSQARVQAGFQNPLQERLSACVNGIAAEMERFLADFLVIAKHALDRFGSEAALDDIAPLLLSTRHRSLDTSLTTFVQDFQDVMLDKDPTYARLHAIINSKWRIEGRRGRNAADMQHLLSAMRDYARQIESLESERAVFRAASVVASSIRSTGSIIVTGRGVYSSTLECSHALGIIGTLHGGFGVAGTSARIGELGSAQEVETSLRVTAANGFAKVKVQHANTLMEVNGRRVRTDALKINTFMGEMRHAESHAS